ncbi:uncharacterized protein B0I36DRAFT_327559 [Microdochium trichocladiopsis]|uniref:Uncharacterized protein n=1 Tax=Microdochium trichocladiopsis TaxID=1682393 RepID=A0A9P9BL30_9PEZI|nr:uncharacterized protein B0I36DRAFT_327559 [Microdochium trichocladiopsis]KAH7027652.1 hypothetical protein B0I36DRAFT_327559 [Microdochium trichocladiopsis]
MACRQPLCPSRPPSSANRVQACLACPGGLVLPPPGRPTRTDTCVPMTSTAHVRQKASAPDELHMLPPPPPLWSAYTLDKYSCLDLDTAAPQRNSRKKNGLCSKHQGAFTDRWPSVTIHAPMLGIGTNRAPESSISADRDVSWDSSQTPLFRNNKVTP